MLELKGIDTWLRLQTRTFVTSFDGALFACFQFHVGQPFQRGRRAEILGGCFSQSRLYVDGSLSIGPVDSASVREESSDSFPESRMKASYCSRDNGSVARSFNRGSRRRRGGCVCRGDCCWRRILAT